MIDTIMIPFIKRLVISCCFVSSLSIAAGEPLVVGITSFTPPFIMQGGSEKTYGFDIDMMNYICRTMQRTCEFRVMRFDELIPGVLNNTIDVAVSAITITADRTKIVNFSLPYLLSYSRFLTKKSDNAAPFTLASLNGKTIGIVSGTIFAEQIKNMAIKNPTIKEYGKIDDLLEALGSGSVDIILLDSPTSIYWEANSSGAFMKVGPAYLYGYGLGIATNPVLVPELNKALLQFENSGEFKANYNKYIMQF